LRARVLASSLLVAVVAVLLVGGPLAVLALSDRDESTGLVVMLWLAAALAALAAAAGVGVLQAKVLRAPLAGLQRRAENLGSGQKREPLRTSGISEVDRVAELLERSADRVDRLIAAERQFASDASHQLRTPLTGLRLRLEEASATATGPALEQVDGALEEVDRLSGVVTELLVLSEAGAARPPDAVCDLLAAARRAGSRWSGHDAEFAVAGSPSLVRATPADVDRVLDAVVENAIDYGVAGQTITLAVAPGRLSVTDQGPGLAAGEEETVFARFHRGTVGRASRRRGTGLGLPIARELASRWHGTVTLANAPSGGAVATITLPPADGTTPNEPTRVTEASGA
jgi:signal transduction histidine kinase